MYIENEGIQNKLEERYDNMSFYISLLQDLWHRDYVRDFDGYKKYAMAFSLTDEEVEESWEWYSHQLWRHTAEYFIRSGDRMCKALGIRI